MQKNIDLLASWQVLPVAGGVRLAYPAPQNARGFTPLGFVRRNDSAQDAMDYDGLALTVNAAPGAKLTVTACFIEDAPLTLALPLAGAGVQQVYLPLKNFPLETAKESLWQFLAAFEITGAALCSAVLAKARGLAAQCPVRGQHANAGETVTYTMAVYNAGPAPAIVCAAQQYAGWESMNATLTPAEFTLAPGEETTVQATLIVPPQMVPGGHEETRLRFSTAAGAEAFITLHTTRTLAHPYLYHDKTGWAQVAEKIKKYPQFRPAFEKWQRTADAWQPAPPAPDVDYCYFTDTEDCTMSAAYCYAVTGQRVYAEKLAQFFRFFTDEQTGYPARRKGCHQSYVQEGHFFQHLAIPYDIIADSGVLTAADHKAIEKSFRLYMAMLDKDIRNGRISNWVLSEVTGALYCALALQDWALAARFVYGPCGTLEQLRCGAFNDGWWHEGSIGYNTWVSSMLLHTARALRPFGVDLVYADFAVPYSREVSSTYAGRAAVPPFNMDNQKRGGNLRPSLHIKDLFDAILPYLDWRGVMFGVNDSDEKTIDGVHFGSTYDLAYTYYKDPAYLPVIRSFAEPDPVFGHGELPKPAADAGGNAFSDNIGLALLRSQTPGRAQKDQLQAVLHYGSHGGAHGHFDMTDLLSVMRCGRSLYNPECSWWGYRHFMYKWHVQNSLTKNMVNVDDKTQLPADSRRILFYTGSALQAAAVETTCRWAYPPYGGMDYDDSPGDFEKRLKMNVAWFPVDKTLPYGKSTGETEPILQRRLLAVTDDYLVLFDCLRGEEPHQYETTFQLKGLRELTATALKPTGHTAQYTTDPASDGQMITDCHWYAAEGTVTARFLNRFGHLAIHGDPSYTETALQGDRSYHNEPGVLHADVYSAWPPQATVVEGLMATYIGWPADKDGYNIPLCWRVEADGEALAQGAFDAWVLGRGAAQVSLKGKKTLTLAVRQGDVENEKGEPVRTPQAVFWGNAVLTLADGSTKPLAELACTAQNTDPGCGIGKDYAGGRVLVMGQEMPDAIPASTVDHNAEGTLSFDLTGLTAVSLALAVGADPYPGNEDQRRHFYAVRAPQKQNAARFVTVLEPYESHRMVQSVQCADADHVTVTLTDGRVQRLTLTGFADDIAAPVLTLSEEKDGCTLKSETTTN